MPSTDFSGTKRFRPIRKLGQGGMGAVYLVHDNQLDSEVALKFLPDTSPQALSLFKQEFRSLTEIVHPNLVSLYELIAEEDQWFFIMEYVQGVSFRDWVRTFTDYAVDADTAEDSETILFDSDNSVEESTESSLTGKHFLQCDWPRLRDAFSQLVGGLNTLHKAGKIHRDVKPSNVLVRESGQVVILDFGLIAELQYTPHSNDSETSNSHGSTIETDIVGTVRYMSPEQSVAQSITVASDFYSVGVMLYEIITGFPPFTGSYIQVISKKQVETPPKVETLVDSIPDDIANICNKLLQIAPESRPTYEELIEVFGTPEIEEISSSHSRKHQKFVGRSSQLKELEAGFASTVEGGKSTVSIYGPSGYGKSTLLDYFFSTVLRNDDAVVLRGRCYEQESVPFKTLDSVVDSLCRYLRQLPTSELASLMPRHIGELSRLFPVLKLIESVKQSPSPHLNQIPPRELRQKAFAALAEIVARIGDRHPLIIHIDDLQWGDNDSVEFLRELLDPRMSLRVMLVMSFRSESGLSASYNELFSHFVSDERINHREIQIGPLSYQDAHQLITSISDASVLPQKTIEKIIADSQGSPLFLQEVAQHLIQNQETSSLELSGLDDVILERTANLSHEEREFLQLLSVSGKPTLFEDLLSGIEKVSDPYRMIARLRSNRLLRGTAVHANDIVEVYHDRVREVVQSHLSDEQRQGFHKRFVETLSKKAEPDAEALAIHCRGCGMNEQAGGWFDQAGDAAAFSLAFDHAISLYQQSLEVRPVTGEAERALREKLAQAYANAGRGSQSADEFIRVAELSDFSDKFDLQAQAASQLCISGHIDKGMKIFRDVLRAYRLKLPESSTGILVDLLWQRLRLWARGTSLSSQVDVEKSTSNFKRIDRLWSISSGLSTVNNLSSAALQTRLLRECLDSGDAYRSARSLAWEGFLTSASGNFWGAEKLLAQATALAESCSNPHANGMCQLAKGMIRFQQAKFQQSIEILNQAENFFYEQVRVGWWELATIRWIRGTALLHAGELNQIEDISRSDYREAKERGDLFAITNMQAYVLPYMELARGNIKTAHELVETARRDWNHNGFHYQHLQSSFMDCMFHLYQGNGAGALDSLESFWPKMKKALVLHNKFVRVMMFDLRANCMLAAAKAADQPEKLLSQVDRVVKLLRKEGDDWSLAFADRVAGSTALARDQHQGAINFWKSSAAKFQQHDMKLQTASVQLALSSLLVGEEANRVRSEAEAILNQEQVVAHEKFCRCLTWR